MSQNEWNWPAENRAFWDASESGKLLVKQCNDCSQPHYYPRIICPYCGSQATEWVEASGKGTLHAYSLFRRASPPQILAYVTLEEGVTMLTEMIECDPEELSINDEVVVAFRRESDGRQIPVFVPANSAN
ncbi:MAG: OB-fold domain-containing protein [Anaerolineales bacterium]